MRFVPVKTAEQQGQLAVHRLREGFKEERTAIINRIRGLLAEVIEDASNELPGVARLALQRAHLHWIDIELQMAWCDEPVDVQPVLPRWPLRPSRPAVHPKGIQLWKNNTDHR
jgi:transposase